MPRFDRFSGAYPSAAVTSVEKIDAQAGGALALPVPACVRNCLALVALPARTRCLTSRIRINDVAECRHRIRAASGTRRHLGPGVCCGAEEQILPRRRTCQEKGFAHAAGARQRLAALVWFRGYRLTEIDVLCLRSQGRAPFERAAGVGWPSRRIELPSRENVSRSLTSRDVNGWRRTGVRSARKLTCKVNARSAKPFVVSNRFL